MREDSDKVPSLLTDYILNGEIFSIQRLRILILLSKMITNGRCCAPGHRWFCMLEPLHFKSSVLRVMTEGFRPRQRLNIVLQAHFKVDH